MIFNLDCKKYASSRADKKDDPQNDRAALDEHGEYEIVDEEAEEETCNTTNDTFGDCLQ